MTTDNVVRIAVDAMGGDFAPTAILSGVELALDNSADIEISLVGTAEVVEGFSRGRDRVTPVVASEIIGMHDHPAQAVRSKRDSSIVVGCRLVKERAVDGFFSAGSTGAAMTAATLVMGRLPGVSRPAIATVIPTIKDPAILLDVGANADCKPEHLLQFAHMGLAYAKAVLGIEAPSVGLLNIGEEPTKGSALAIEAHGLMSDGVPGFVGNVEGRDVLAGETDVIVTDGFTGNVALKLLEGASSALLGQIKDAMTSSVTNRVAAAVLLPSMRRLKERLDPETHGGAPLLGVDGICIIGHGSSSAKAVAAGISVAATAARHSLPATIASALNQE